MMITGLKLCLKLIFVLLLLIALAYLALALSRPPRTNYQASLFRGVTYTRRVQANPRPLMVHLVEIDLLAPGLRLLVTPGDEKSELDFFARTTSHFLAEFKLQLALNGSFFKPFHDRTPWDYYPHSGDPVDVSGLSISNGRVYSAGSPYLPTLCLSAGLARIRLRCPLETDQALAGGAFLIRRGASVVQPNSDDVDDLHPRTAIAVDKSGARLWLMVVDGRQTGYSEGVTLAELAELLLPLGVETALNLDGGGSTTLVMAGDQGPEALNAPIHTRIPMRQRPVANHLGIYAQPLP